MAFGPSPMRKPLTRDEVGTLFGRTMTLVAVTAGLFALGAYIGRDASVGFGWVWFVAALVTLFGVGRAVEKSQKAAMLVLFGFGTLLGLAIAPTINHHTATNPQAVWNAGVAAALFVAAFGAAGYATRRDLSGLARYLLIGLIALLVFGIVAAFAHIPEASVIYAVIGLLIFGGLTAFDFQRLRSSQDIRDAPVLAASIFLDAVNVFLLLLSLFDGTESEQ
jgi:modulator of FtsH protease